MNELVDLINTIGFPIAMVIYFIYDKNKMNEKMMASQKENTEVLANTLSSNTDSIVKNTIILEKLLSKLGIEDI